MLPVAKKTKIPLFEPALTGNEWKYVKECLDTNWISSAGKSVERFEQKLAEYLNVPTAVAVVNGTSALHIALLLAEIGPGDEVLVPTLTFIAPIHAVQYVQAKPVFMDCDEFLNIDVEKVRAFCERNCAFDGKILVNKKTRARVRGILPVHVFGHPVRMEPLLALAKKYNLTLVEDAAESIGSSYAGGALDGKQTGTIGNFGCFSFNGNKIVTAGGGGAIVAKSAQLINRAKYLTTQAKDDPELFIHHNVGYNYRLNSVQAAMGCAQLEQLDEYIKLKRKNLERYQTELAGIEGISLLTEPPYAKSNYWLYTIHVNTKEYGTSVPALKGELGAQGIQARFVWHPNHLQRPYQNCESFQIENALRFQKECLNLPSSVYLDQAQIKQVCECIREAGR